MLGELVIRDALPADVRAICDFGAAHVTGHYQPLIGDDAALAQVEAWWNQDRITRAVAERQVVIAEASDQLVGVAERGEWEGQPVVWKLYVHPNHRRQGVGPKLLRALIEQLPVGTQRLQVEHFEANRLAGKFYERLGFKYLRTEGDPSIPATAAVWRVLDLTAGRDGSAGLDLVR